MSLHSRVKRIECEIRKEQLKNEPWNEPLTITLGDRTEAEQKKMDRWIKTWKRRGMPFVETNIILGGDPEKWKLNQEDII